MTATGRTRISRAMHEDGPNITGFTDENALPTTASKSKSRRKSGRKHRDKRSRDYHRRMTNSQSDSDLLSDAISEIKKNTPGLDENAFPTATAPNDPTYDSSSSSDSLTSAEFKNILATRRRFKKLSRQRATHRSNRKPSVLQGISSDSDDYTTCLYNDLTGHQIRSSKSTSVVSAKTFSSWWRENGTKWQGPTYDSKYPFNSWKQDWGRLLDVDFPYFEAVPTPPQQRDWFWDTCGPQVRQHRHSIIHAGEKAKILRLRSHVPVYGALEMIAVVHWFFYPEEETAARITEWNSLTFTSAGEKLLERWSTFYFYLRNFQYTLPADMHTPTTLYLKLLTIVDNQPWWQHPLQVLELLGRDPDKIYNLSRSCISTWIRSSGHRQVPSILPANPPPTPTVSFATPTTVPEPPTSPPPR